MQIHLYNWTLEDKAVEYGYMYYDPSEDKIYLREPSGAVGTRHLNLIGFMDGIPVLYCDTATKPFDLTSGANKGCSQGMTLSVRRSRTTGSLGFVYVASDSYFGPTVKYYNCDSEDVELASYDITSLIAFYNKGESYQVITPDGSTTVSIQIYPRGGETTMLGATFKFTQGVHSVMSGYQSKYAGHYPGVIYTHPFIKAGELSDAAIMDLSTGIKESILASEELSETVVEIATEATQPIIDQAVADFKKSANDSFVGC